MSRAPRRYDQENPGAAKRFPKASGYGHTHSGMDVRPHDFTSACHWPIGRSVRPVDTVAQDRIIGVGHRVIEVAVGGPAEFIGM